MTGKFSRFAVYYAPPKGSEFAQAGAAWLGWDADTGQACAQPDLGLDLASITATPRKYGLHGTLKPPMRLACADDIFLDAVDTLAKGLAPVEMGALRLRMIDGFLAVVPDVQPLPLADIAQQIVRALDPFRAPLSETELARRRAAGLSARQEDLLLAWGYPYVMEEFRFHVTLSGRLAPAQVTDTLRAAYAWFDPALQEPHHLQELAVFGEDTTGQFHLVTRFPLGG